jgi:hypothetical protein
MLTTSLDDMMIEYDDLDDFDLSFTLTAFKTLKL